MGDEDKIQKFLRLSGQQMNMDNLKWEVWYQDLFDRECPRQVDISGIGLQKGLFELWSRHLKETVQETGGRGFGRFNLWLKHEMVSIEIKGEWEGQVRLRKWVYGGEKGGRDLLNQIAIRHASHILNDESSEAILHQAKVAENRADFENWLVR